MVPSAFEVFDGTVGLQSTLQAKGFLCHLREAAARWEEAETPLGRFLPSLAQ
jgi:hypothetical protein